MFKTDRKTEIMKVYGEKRNSCAPKNGVKVLLDSEDEDRVKDRVWHIRFTNGIWNVYTPIRIKGKLTYWSLHRFLFNLEPLSTSPQVTLKDGCVAKPNPEYLDFRKNNLVFRSGLDSYPQKRSLEGNYSIFDNKKKENSNHPLIQYIKDGKKKIGCVVANGPNSINWSLCAKEDTFSKKEAKEIAFQRLNQGIPYQVLFIKKLVSKIDDYKSSDLRLEKITQWFDNWDGNPKDDRIEPVKAHRFRILHNALQNMEIRATKYYK